MSTITCVFSVRLASSSISSSSRLAPLRTSAASTVSLKVEAVSASGIGVSVIMDGTRQSIRLLNAWPSSCASVLTSERLPVKLVITRLMFLL